MSPPLTFPCGHYRTTTDGATVPARLSLRLFRPAAVVLAAVPPPTRPPRSVTAWRSPRLPRPVPCPGPAGRGALVGEERCAGASWTRHREHSGRGCRTSRYRRWCAGCGWWCAACRKRLTVPLSHSHRSPESCGATRGRRHSASSTQTTPRRRFSLARVEPSPILSLPQSGAVHEAQRPAPRQVRVSIPVAGSCQVMASGPCRLPGPDGKTRQPHEAPRRHLKRRALDAASEVASLA